MSPWKLLILLFSSCSKPSQCSELQPATQNTYKWHTTIKYSCSVVPLQHCQFTPKYSQKKHPLDELWGVNCEINVRFILYVSPCTAVFNTDPDSKVHGANMGPTWVLSAPDGPHVGPMNLAVRGVILDHVITAPDLTNFTFHDNSGPFM